MPKQRAANQISPRKPRLAHQVDVAGSCKSWIPPRVPGPPSGRHKQICGRGGCHRNRSHDQSASRRTVDHDKVKQGQDSHGNPLPGEVRCGRGCPGFTGARAGQQENRKGFHDRQVGGWVYCQRPDWRVPTHFAQRVQIHLRILHLRRQQIKGIEIKSRHASELRRAYQEVYKWCKTRGFKPELTEWTTRPAARWRSSLRVSGLICNILRQDGIAPQRKRQSRHTSLASNPRRRRCQAHFQYLIGATCLNRWIWK